MTTGEIIQHNRKKLGLSQEQLGDQLMVSRQTISLWEKDQTLPTIENLVRIKEIFGISVDEILTGERDIQKNAVVETYEFQYTKEEIDSVYNAFDNGRIPLIVFSILIFGAGVIAYFISGYIPLFGFLMGALAIHVFYNIIIAVKNKKLRKKSTDNLLSETHTINVYKDCFYINAYCEKKLRGSMRFNYSELDNVKDIANHFVIVYLNQYYLIGKQNLSEKSLLYRELSVKAHESQPKQMTRAQRNICYVLILSTFLSVLLSYIIPISLSPEHTLSYDVVWINYLFIPVPLALFILGIFFKTRKIRFAKSFLIGAMGIFYFAAMGSFWLVPYIVQPDESKYSEEQLQLLEEKLNFDFPETYEVNYINVSDMNQDSKDGYWLNGLLSVWYYSDEANKKLISQINESDIWLEEIPKELKAIEPPLLEPDCYNYVTFYNENDKTFNALPKHNDESNFYTCVFYRSDYCVLDVFEYEVNI